jgi:uncharacterized small protein (DUF1192 family)
MKTTNYRLESELERLGPLGQEQWFKGYLKEVLESDRPYYAKADYIALSFMELENKIDYLTQEIQTLTALKKRLQEAKGKGLEIAAALMREYGIEKLEGVAVSSLTITPPKEKVKEKLHIKNPDKVMELGYVTFSVDEKAVQQALSHPELSTELLPYVEVERSKENIPAKVRINKKRTLPSSIEEPTELLPPRAA